MRVLDLFSGIGGFSLGLERAGFKTVAFCEIEPFCRQVLKKHWPEVPIYEDVRELTAARLESDGITVNAISAGFPCQDVSSAGKQVGLDGARSGLYSEVIRLAGDIRPELIILENVSALLYLGLGRVLGDLAEVGYDAEWHCISASHIGAPHERDRIWIVAYPNSAQREGGWLSGGVSEELFNFGGNSWWSDKPAMDRVANGIPDQSHRLKAIGNAVIPAIPELIGRAIMKVAA